MSVSVTSHIEVQTFLSIVMNAAVKRRGGFSQLCQHCQIRSGHLRCVAATHTTECWFQLILIRWQNETDIKLKLFKCRGCCVVLKFIFGLSKLEIELQIRSEWFASWKTHKSIYLFKIIEISLICNEPRHPHARDAVCVSGPVYLPPPEYAGAFKQQR